MYITITGTQASTALYSGTSIVSIAACVGINCIAEDGSRVGQQNVLPAVHAKLTVEVEAMRPQ